MEHKKAIRPVYVQDSRILLRYVLYTSESEKIKGVIRPLYVHEREGEEGKSLVKAENQEMVTLKQLLREYKVLLKAQVRQYFRKIESDKMNKILASMCRQKMICMKDCYIARNQQDFLAVDDKRLKAFWVLLDFGETAYHSLGDWPVQISFFANETEGEIIYAALGEERLLNAMIKGAETKRIVIVEEPDQIMALELEGVMYYCTVDHNGQVVKYVKE